MQIFCRYVELLYESDHGSKFTINLLQFFTSISFLFRLSKMMVVVLLYMFANNVSMDMIGDVSKKIGDIKDDLDDIDGVLTLKDEQIKHLQLAVVSAEMKQATSRQSWLHGRMGFVATFVVNKIPIYRP